MATLKKALALAAAILVSGQSIATMRPATTASAYNSMISLSETDIPTTGRSITYVGGTSLNITNWTGTGWNNTGDQKYRSSITANNSLKITSVAPSELLRRYTITTNIKLSNTSITATQVKNMMTLGVVSYTAGSSTGAKQNYPLTVTGSNGTFEAKTVIICYGDDMQLSYDFKKSYNSRINLYGTSIVGADVGYSINKSLYGSNDIYASVPTKASSTDWLVRCCQLFNSMKDITGITNSNVYFVMDDPLVTKITADHTVFSRNQNTTVIRCPSSMTEQLKKSMRGGYFDLDELTALADSYAYKGTSGTGVRFQNAFEFGDRYCNNVTRGMVALQNCQQLRSVRVYNKELEGGTYAYAMLNIEDSIPLASRSVDLKMATLFSAYGCLGGWEYLENYLGAEGDIMMNSAALNKAITIFQANSNYANGWRMTNSDNYCYLNALRYLANEHEIRFEVFIDGYFDSSSVIKFSQMLANRRSDTPSGDVNQSGNTNSTDVTKLSQFIGSNTILPAKGVFNGDMNKDGYINQADVDLLRNKI